MTMEAYAEAGRNAPCDPAIPYYFESSGWVGGRRRRKYIEGTVERRTRSYILGQVASAGGRGRQSLFGYSDRH